MCLYTREKLPRVAKRDIVCLKILNEVSNGVYKTPYQGVEVSLNSKIKASPKKVEIGFCTNDNLENAVYTINGGAIHSVLLDESRCRQSSCIKKAIIPKGTEYYLGCFGLEVASEELYIADKDADIEDLDTEFLNELLEEAPTCNGIRVGDYLMSSGEFVHPSKKLPKTKVIGIVVGFHKDNPLIAALDRLDNVSFGSYPSDVIDRTFTERKDALKDFDGKGHTDKYVKYKENKEHTFIYKAFQRSVEYKKKAAKNWYLPALGEMMQMLNNALYINIAYRISGLGYLVDTSGWYWTSSECSGRYSWCCRLDGGEVYCYWDCRCYRYRVVPFLAYNDNQDKPKGLISKLKKLCS